MQAARGTSLNPDVPDPDSASPTDRASFEGQAPHARPLPLRVGRLTFLVIASFGYGLDVVTKRLAVDRLSDGDVPVLGDLLVFHLVRNPGAAFGTGERFTVALSAVAVIATCVVLYLGSRVRSRLWAVALGFLLAGVLGNLTDRLLRAPGPFRGHVVDFIQVPNWPVFNLADVCINLAAALILVQAFRGVRVDGSRDPLS
jgi:signal peptidase II